MSRTRSAAGRRLKLLGITNRSKADFTWLIVLISYRYVIFYTMRLLDS